MLSVKEIIYIPHMIKNIILIKFKIKIMMINNNIHKINGYRILGQICDSFSIDTEFTRKLQNLVFGQMFASDF